MSHKEEWYLKKNAELMKTLRKIQDIIEDPDISYPVTCWKINELLKKTNLEPSLSVVTK